MSHCGDDLTGSNALCFVDLNNRRTGKHATKPRALGLLGHSVQNIVEIMYKRMRSNLCGLKIFQKYSLYIVS